MHELHIRKKIEEAENRGRRFPKLALKIVFWTHFQKGDVIIFQKFQSMHEQSTKRLALPMDSFRGQNHRYCLLSTASSPSITSNQNWGQSSRMSLPWFINPCGISATGNKKSRLAIKFPIPMSGHQNNVPPRKTKIIKFSPLRTEKAIKSRMRGDVEALIIITAARSFQGWSHKC